MSSRVHAHRHVRAHPFPHTFAHAEEDGEPPGSPGWRHDTTATTNDALAAVRALQGRIHALERDCAALEAERTRLRAAARSEARSEARRERPGAGGGGGEERAEDRAAPAHSSATSARRRPRVHTPHAAAAAAAAEEAAAPRVPRPPLHERCASPGTNALASALGLPPPARTEASEFAAEDELSEGEVDPVELSGLSVQDLEWAAAGDDAEVELQEPEEKAHVRAQRVRRQRAGAPRGTLAAVEAQLVELESTLESSFSRSRRAAEAIHDELDASLRPAALPDVRVAAAAAAAAPPSLAPVISSLERERRAARTLCASLAERLCAVVGADPSASPSAGIPSPSPRRARSTLPRPGGVFALAAPSETLRLASVEAEAEAEAESVARATRLNARLRGALAALHAKEEQIARAAQVEAFNASRALTVVDGEPEALG